MTCHLYENVTIKLLTPEFLFDYENLNPIFFSWKQIRGYSLFEWTHYRVSLRKKKFYYVHVYQGAPGNCDFIMDSNYIQSKYDVILLENNHEINLWPL